MPPGLEKPFWALVLKSPMAIACMGLSAFLGYGISFVIFDYRKSSVAKSHYGLHMVLGLAYTALVFCVVNADILTRKLTADAMADRMPLTMLVSFALGFVLLLGGMIWKEVKRPYAGRSKGKKA